MELQDHLSVVSELVCGSNHTFIEALLSLVFFFLWLMTRVAGLRFAKGHYYAVFGVSSIFLAG